MPKASDEATPDELGHDLAATLVAELLDFLLRDVSVAPEAGQLQKLAALPDEELFKSLSASSKVLYRYKSSLAHLLLNSDLLETFRDRLNRELKQQLAGECESTAALPDVSLDVAQAADDLMLQLQSAALEANVSAQGERTELSLGTNAHAQIAHLTSLYDSLPFH